MAAGNIETLRDRVAQLGSRVEDHARALVEGAGTPNLGLNIRYVRAKETLAVAEGREQDAIHDRRVLSYLIRRSNKSSGPQVGTFDDPAMADWLGVGLATGEVDARFAGALPARYGTSGGAANRRV